MKYYLANINDKKILLSILQSRYYDEGNLALQAFDINHMPFATITKNLSDRLHYDEAYVDVGNCLWALDLIDDYQLGTFTGEVKSRGYVTYPLYKFNLDKIEKKG